MASRNGLNPKIRGPKGVGWGRALPAPFGFDNGFIGTGTNGSHFMVPLLAGKSFPSAGTIEFWQTIPIENDGECVIHFTFQDGTDLSVLNYYPVALLNGAGHISPDAFPVSASSASYGIKYHCALTWNSVYVDAWANAVLPSAFNGPAFSPLSSAYGTSLLSGVSIGSYVDGTRPLRSKIDELRVYNRELTLTELVQNDGYNKGGANPSKTEGLFIWYQFEEFEDFDFSSAQDGSDIALGVRDLSGQNNHAKAISLNTDATSPTYVLKPF